MPKVFMILRRVLTDHVVWGIHNFWAKAGCENLLDLVLATESCGSCGYSQSQGLLALTHSQSMRHTSPSGCCFLSETACTEMAVSQGQKGEVAANWWRAMM